MSFVRREKNLRTFETIRSSGFMKWALLGVLVLLSFFHVKDAAYVSWDDNVLITNNPILSYSFSQAVTTVFSNYYHGDFIPLTLLSFWLEIRAFGFGPEAQHLTNVILHFLNLILLQRILQRFKLDAVSEFFILLVFAVHPLQVESVAWISERKGLAAAFFTFSSILLYLDFRSSGRKLLLVFSSLLYFCALGFKTSPILFPVLLIFMDRLHTDEGWRRLLSRQASFLTIAFVFSLIRISAYSSNVQDMTSALSAPWLAVLPLRVLHAIGFYLMKFAFPIGLSPVYPDFSLDAWAWFLIAVALITLIALAISIRKSPLPTKIAGLAIFILSLVPVLHLVPRINHVNDRYMYLAIIGLAMIAASIGKSFLRFLTPMILICWTFLSFQQSHAWKNSLSLWYSAAAVVPENPIVQNNLALELQKSGYIAEATATYERALALNPHPAFRSLLANNLGIIYSNTGYAHYDLNRAAMFFQQAIGNAPTKQDAFEARYNLAMVNIDRGNRQEAIRMLQELKQDLEKSDIKHRWLKDRVQGQLSR